MTKHKIETLTTNTGIITIPCTGKITYGFISQTGKSFVYRERMEDGGMTPYKFTKLPFAIHSMSNGFYNTSNVFNFDFGNGDESAIRISYHKI